MVTNLNVSTVASLAPLRAAFKERGWHKKATARVLVELAVHTLISVSGQALYIFSHDWPTKLLGLAISTYGTLGVATNAHTSSHNGTFERRWLNDAFTLYSFTFFVGMPSTAWRHMHLVVHHPAPNVMGVDDDASFAPFFASTDREVEEATGLWRTYLRYQWLFFPLICWVNVFLRHRGGWAYMLKHLRDPELRKAAHWRDLGAVLLHYATWVGVPALFIGWQQAIVFYLLRISVLGYPLFCVLAPAHYPAEAGVLERGDYSKDFVLLQTATTVNFRTGLLGRFVCSGLEYQIEHHLFPGYSHVHYPKMSVLVREFCERENYPYRTLGWAEGVWKTFAIFYTPKRQAKSPSAIRETRTSHANCPVPLGEIAAHGTRESHLETH